MPLWLLAACGRSSFCSCFYFCCLYCLRCLYFRWDQHTLDWSRLAGHVGYIAGLTVTIQNMYSPAVANMANVKWLTKCYYFLAPLRPQLFLLASTVMNKSRSTCPPASLYQRVSGALCSNPWVGPADWEISIRPHLGRRNHKLGWKMSGSARSNPRVGTAFESDVWILIIIQVIETSVFLAADRWALPNSGKMPAVVAHSHRPTTKASIR